MIFTSKDFKSFLSNVVEVIEENKDYLSELDRKIGDGDHGVTMSIGWQAINEKLQNELLNEEDCSKISVSAGRTFLSAVGSSVGPLYATGFLRGAKAIQNKKELTDENLKDFWIAFILGVQERGQAEIGDKTMIDTLLPAKKELELQYGLTGNLYESFLKALTVAKKGMESTKEMLSKRGRSSRLGERSIGNQDPGATSAYLILLTFFQTLKTVQEV
ncbi:dihydroxyacetone kinase subunit DhaL [Bacillus sp. V5-8f]|uniref:dihydroxyacetone kinase subunit DhaL n=1 Tax=Bacillus sp. V5-8f TaxID=2053044 RepID=UPI000C75B473|nr:dihydroxyacetone kinase subunit DhaL [Bacillus sp. V5-8f]PLT33726.1 dihydroxyacetone kinase subunit L [Bacillus sp. V5-8f]